MKTKRIINQIGVVFVTCLFILLSSQIAMAATYYIDYVSGSDSYNGTSTSTPWQRCPGMKGFTGSYTHAAGDRFVFKGGVTWPYAALPLTIKYSGVSGNPDVYTSDKSWYNGASWTRPIFDGENQPASYAPIIYALSKTHFTLEYIKITGAGLEGADDDKSYGISLNGSYGTGLNGVTIQYMELIPFSASNLVLAACGGGATTTGLVIQYNTFYGSMNHLQMGCTDNTSTVDGMIIRGNTFSGYTQLSSSSDHPDGIHFHNKSGALRRFSNLEISGNKFYGTWMSNNTGQIFFEDSVSSAKIFNNVFTINNSVGAGKYIFSPGQVAVYGSDNVEIYNNTFCTDTIGGTPNWPLSNIIFSVGSSAYNGTFKVKNNIFSGARRSVIYAPTMKVDIDYNLHTLSFSGFPGSWDANDKTWSQWQTQGNDLYGISADPKFVSIPTDLSLQSDSPAINKGVDLSASFTKDLLGKARPTGAGTWDIGAYEYVPAQSSLFVTSVNGTVTSNPSGINCGSTCYANFDAEASVTLTALPKSGYTSSGWSGGGCSGTGSCIVKMASAQVVTANYTTVTLPATQYYLSIGFNNAGSVTASDGSINCGSTCKAYYSAGKTVTITATANRGYKFYQWVNACKGQGATCTLNMNVSKSDKAYFVKIK